MEMNKFYFTFGCHHELSDKVQPIVAQNMKQAMKCMFVLHGKDWALDYTSEEYNQRVLIGILPRKQELETVVV